ncbi:hypothetical protein [Halorarum halobium]|uniref:hypothetical protein n=1 Tax=Halorarum halobium TaxID=3075121 RepID=UPI0028B08C36|nr:hypothetical protein [Halobaculum sp. XH14]
MTRRRPTVDRPAAPVGEADAPLVPDLGRPGRAGEPGPRPRRRRTDPFELDLMEDAE